MSVIFPSEFEAQIFGSNGASKFMQQVEIVDDPEELVRIADFYLYRSRLGSTILQAAMKLEPHNTASDDYDITHKAASSYYRGAMFAMGGLWRQISSMQRHAMASIVLPDMAEPKLAAQASLDGSDAQVSLGIGRVGFAQAGAYHEIFDDFEDAISRSNETIGAARAGFGLPFYILSNAIEAELASIVDATNSNEWDAALAELISEQEK